MTKNHENEFENGIDFPFTSVDNNIIDTNAKEVFGGMGEKALFIVIMRHAFKIGQEARPSQKTMAEKVGADPRSVRRYLDNLQDRGFLKKIGYHEQYGTVIWRVTVPDYLQIKWTEERLEQLKAKAASNADNNQEPQPPAKDPEPKPAAAKEPDPEPVEKIPYKEIIDYLNAKAGKRYGNIKTNHDYIRPRWKEGYTLEDFKTVIDNQVAEWKGVTFTDGRNAEKYLCPETLFSRKFEKYLNNTPKPKQQQKKKLFAEPKKKEEVSPIAELNGQFFDTRIPEEKAMYKHLLAIDMGLIDPQEPQQ